MIVLSRKRGESFVIGDAIFVSLKSFDESQVVLRVESASDFCPVRAGDAISPEVRRIWELSFDLDDDWADREITIQQDVSLNIKGLWGEDRDKVRIAVEHPPGLPVHRREVWEATRRSPE